MSEDQGREGEAEQHGGDEERGVWLDEVERANSGPPTPRAMTRKIISCRGNRDRSESTAEPASVDERVVRISVIGAPG
jgi:hypothetical protein